MKEWHIRFTIPKSILKNEIQKLLKANSKYYCIEETINRSGATVPNHCHLLLETDSSESTLRKTIRSFQSYQDYIKKQFDTCLKYNQFPVEEKDFIKPNVNGYYSMSKVIESKNRSKKQLITYLHKQLESGWDNSYIVVNNMFTPSQNKSYNSEYWQTNNSIKKKAEKKGSVIKQWCQFALARSPDPDDFSHFITIAGEFMLEYNTQFNRPSDVEKLYYYFLLREYPDKWKVKISNNCRINI